MRFAATFLAALCCATSTHAGVTQAQYSEPTTRYSHGILGDAIEYGALVLSTNDGKTLTLRLPESRVFEDIKPRLLDVDMDGDNEVVVVETSLTRGARLAIYDETGLVSATPFIGQSNRWLAPLGGHDLDGDGFLELAYIDRPHLAKVLRIWRFKDGALHHVADQSGLTNHKIGEDFISGGIRTCEGLPEIITANAAWTSIISTTFTASGFTSRTLGPFTGPASLKAAKNCP